MSVIVLQKAFGNRNMGFDLLELLTGIAMVINIRKILAIIMPKMQQSTIKDLFH